MFFGAMKEADPNGESRREFLRGGARYTLLTVLGAVSALLAKRSGGKLSGQTCVNQGICSGCTAFSGCGLPQALSAKQVQSGTRRREPAQTSRQERGVHAASTSMRETTLKRAEARAPEAA